MVPVLNLEYPNRDKSCSLASLSQEHIAKQLQPVQPLRKSNSNSSPSSILENNKTSLPQLSAVFVPLIQREGTWHVLFIRRSETVSSHKGQIAFPGGRWEENDSTLQETALRETREELGETICPAQLLGTLPSVTTHSTGYIIYPFVGILEEPLALEPDSWEVAEVLILPLSIFLTPTKDGEWVAFNYGTINVWGATARIMQHFITCLQLGESS